MTSHRETERERKRRIATTAPKRLPPAFGPTARLRGLKTVHHSQSTINHSIMTNRARRIPVTLPTLPPKPE